MTQVSKGSGTPDIFYNASQFVEDISLEVYGCYKGNKFCDYIFDSDGVCKVHGSVI